MPVISVVVGTYNRAGYLAECIKSVFEQRGVSYELVISDDGSTDGTADMVRSLAPDTTFVSAEHVGHPSIVYNRGIRAARGEFVAFCADDDMLMPDSLRIRYDRIKDRNGTALACGGAAIIFNDTTFAEALALWERNLLPLDSMHYADMSILHGDSIMVPRVVMEKYGIFDEHPALRLGQDSELWVRWRHAGIEAVHCRVPVAFCRHHGAQLNYDYDDDHVKVTTHEYRNRILEERRRGITAENTPMLGG